MHAANLGGHWFKIRNIQNVTSYQWIECPNVHILEVMKNIQIALVIAIQQVSNPICIWEVHNSETPFRVIIIGKVTDLKETKIKSIPDVDWCTDIIRTSPIDLHITQNATHNIIELCESCMCPKASLYDFIMGDSAFEINRFVI